MKLALTALMAFITFCVAHAYNFTSEKEVSIKNRQADINLGGTLAVPSNTDPRALLLLVSGSGAQNRDEEIMGHRPFKVLSDSLVSHGFGVLRMDDRGVGASGGKTENATIADLVADATYCIEYLRQLYPTTPIGVLGHSQGGQIAVKSAANHGNDPNFIITLAAPAWQGDSIIMSQSRAIAMAMTGSWSGETIERQLLDIAKSSIPSSTARILLYQILADAVGEAISLPQVQQQLQNQVDQMLTVSYRDLLRYNPAEDIAAVNVPWLALNGDKDIQVLVENLETINALNPNVTTTVLPHHNHLFQPATTGMVNEYPTLGQSPSNKTIEIIVDFLKQITR